MTLFTSLIIGFLWGTLISVVNYLYLQWVMKKNASKSPDKATLAVVNAHFLRYFLNIAALVAVYRHAWVLVGTAGGLLVMNVATVIRYYGEGKKQIEQSKRRKLLSPSPDGSEKRMPENGSSPGGPSPRNGRSH